MRVSMWCWFECGNCRPRVQRAALGGPGSHCQAATPGWRAPLRVRHYTPGARRPASLQPPAGQACLGCPH